MLERLKYWYWKMRSHALCPRWFPKDREAFCRQQFKQQGGEYTLDLDHPKSFNEKVTWMMLYYHDPLMSVCADKYAVREYIASKIGEQYLVNLLNVYDRVEDIDLSALPDRFALKVNWGSGQNIVCHDKAKLDWADAQAKLRKWMQPQSNHYFYNFEWVYKNIRPRIVCEEYIDQLDGEDLRDYKLFCLNGKAAFYFVNIDRYNGEKRNFYDLDWNQLPFYNGFPNSPKIVERPAQLDLIVQLAEKLAKPFPLVRVDFYVVNDQLKVGEMTFYHYAGSVPFHPEEWDYKLGAMFELPKKKMVHKYAYSDKVVEFSLKDVMHD